MRNYEFSIHKKERRKTRRNSTIKCACSFVSILAWIITNTNYIENTKSTNYILDYTVTNSSVDSIETTIPEETSETSSIIDFTEETITSNSIQENNLIVCPSKKTSKFKLNTFLNPLIANNSTKHNNSNNYNKSESITTYITTEITTDEVTTDTTYEETIIDSSNIPEVTTEYISDTLVDSYISTEITTDNDTNTETTVIETTDFTTTEETTTIYDGPVLTKRSGTIMGPSGKETYYNLNMSKIVSYMRTLGYSETDYPYWIRDDGVKMLGDYVMVAANLQIRPRGTILPCSLGDAIVCDTGGFAKKHPYQLDIATNW